MCVRILGVTDHPDGARTTQQARDLLGDRTGAFAHLTRDRGGQFTDGSDAAFASKGIEVRRSPPKPPAANGTPSGSRDRSAPSAPTGCRSTTSTTQPRSWPSTPNTSTPTGASADLGEKCVDPFGVRPHAKAHEDLQRPIQMRNTVLDVIDFQEASIVGRNPVRFNRLGAVRQRHHPGTRTDLAPMMGHLEHQLRDLPKSHRMSTTCLSVS